MKRTPFKRKTLAEVKEKKAKKVVKKVKAKTKQKWADFLETHSWYKSIPEGSHGSNPIEKKLWRLVTDYVRIRDFSDYGNCISCGRQFDCWEEAQGGHYRPFSKCKGYTKFDYRGVFAQCAYCNSRMNDDKFEGGRIFADNIVFRYGKRHLNLINEFVSEKYSAKREYPQLITMMLDIICLMSRLDDKPDYYDKIVANPSIANSYPHLFVAY